MKMRQQRSGMPSYVTGPSMMSMAPTGYAWRITNIFNLSALLVCLFGLERGDPSNWRRILLGTGECISTLLVNLDNACVNSEI